MDNIIILDCTLRDGGYVNDFNFGNAVMCSIISKLTKANIDIIECGFLEDTPHGDTVSIFNNIADIKKMLPKEQKKSEYVAMIAYGKYSLDNIEICDGTSITGIRIIFRQNEIEDALQYCAKVKEKGYKVFLQPVSMDTYNDKQLIDIITKANEIEPYAFYIVDTLGLMNQKDVKRFSYLLDNNLLPSIAIGFHSHNNLQLSFSNAQKFLDIDTNRTKIVDASIYGMGRGAGNLATELIAQYINDNYEWTYDANYLLKIYEQHIKKIREYFEWGYSVPFYLAAIHKCHPNYAKFLMDLGTLSINDIGNILMTITPEFKHLYDKNYITNVYLDYQNKQIDDSFAYSQLKPLICNKPVLIIAPGKSISEHTDKIKQYIDSINPYICSVNHINKTFVPDVAFFPNRKRYDEMLSNTEYFPETKIIVSSNIEEADKALKFNYADLSNTNGKFIDNATIMFLKLLFAMKPSSVALAGMDGFSLKEENYYNGDFSTIKDKQIIFDLNKSIGKAIAYYSKNMNIKFITHSIYGNELE